jgi:7-carboxy-7-deazaguanine synthase
VLTGGEPLLQVDTALIEALHAHGFAIAIETNGTIAPPDGLD